MRSGLVLRLGSLLAISFAAASAHASTDVDLRTFHPSTDAAGTLATEPIATPGPGTFQFGGWFSYATPTLRADDPVDGTTARRTVVGSQLVFDPTIGLGIGRRASIGLTMPLLLAQSTEASSVSDGIAPSAHGLGNLALTGKVVLRAPGHEDIGGLSLGLLGRVDLPTGDRSSYLADSATSVDVRAMASWDYAHTIVATGVLGYRLRTATYQLADVRIGDAIPWGVTLSLKPLFLSGDAAKKWLWNLEAHGEIGAGPMKFLSDARVSPVLVGASARYEITNGLSLFVGAETGLTAALGDPRFRGVLGLTFAPKILDEDEDGVPDDVDECPGLPEDGLGPHPHDGCPDDSGASSAPTPTSAAPDADQDGVPDTADKCPKEPETANGYEDEDGCPERDQDGDTFLDAVDKCPTEPETFNGIDDDDGCPDAPSAGKVAAAPFTERDDAGAPSMLVLAHPIAFDGAAPAKSSTADLRALAAWLLAHPTYRVAIAVKPEGDGEEASRVSKQRAEAIAQAVVRYAHTGGVAGGTIWDPAKTPATSNVQIFVEATSSAPPPP